MSNKPKTNYKPGPQDIAQTPPHAIEPLLPYLPTDWIIWESAAGPEHILYHAFEDRGYHVIGTDLLYGERYNFFTYQPDEWTIQITNMPFSIKYKWLARSFELDRPFALLAPYETTFAKDFQVLFRRYNNNPWPIEVLSPERRINYKMPNMGWGITEYDESKGKIVKRGDSAQMPTAWITWGLDVYKERGDYLRTYYVPMRKVRYNDDNTEKT
jgi:hypothetical protein